MNYTQSHKNKNNAFKYDQDLYGKDTFDSKLWEVEKYILSDFFKGIYKNIDVLDFACGTGRVTQFIEKFEFHDIYGFDVSNEMLEIAKTKLYKTTLINIDINNEDATLYKNKFGLITAFRFFLNSENKLKDVTFKNLHDLLANGGYLIFNIHGNKRSLRFLYVLTFNIKQKIRYFIFNKKVHFFTYKRMMSVSQVKKYLAKHDFELVSIISYSFLTKFFEYLLPKNVFVFLEKKFYSKRFLFGTHLLFIVKKIN